MAHNRNDLIVVDGHQDLAYNVLAFGRDYRRSALETRVQERESPAGAASGSCMIGLPELLAGNVALVFGTIFTMPARRALSALDTVYEDEQAAHSQGMQQLDVYHRWADEEPRIALVGCRADLDSVLATWQIESAQEGDDSRQVGIVPLMENADPIREPCRARVVGRTGRPHRWASLVGQPIRRRHLGARPADRPGARTPGVDGRAARWAGSEPHGRARGFGGLGAL